jgi:hypothetical protein
MSSRIDLQILQIANCKLLIANCVAGAGSPRRVSGNVQFAMTNLQFAI